MKKINTKLIEKFKSETGNNAIYSKSGATYHTLKYVNWLEDNLKRSDNTGSPKLPPYGEYEAWCRNASIHISVCKPIYEWFGRQLRAGA